MNLLMDNAISRAYDLLTVFGVREAHKYIGGRFLVHTFGLSRAVINTFEQENNMNSQSAKEVDLYLQGNSLIVNCLKSGSYLSNSVRGEILEGIFQPLPNKEFCEIINYIFHKM